MVFSMKEKNVMMLMLLKVMDATTAKSKMDGNVNKGEDLFAAQGRFPTVEMVFMNHKLVKGVMTATTSTQMAAPTLVT